MSAITGSNSKPRASTVPEASPQNMKASSGSALKPTRTSMARTIDDGLLRAPEEPRFERLQAFVARERAQVLRAAVGLRDGQVVLERGVRLLERVFELVALEDVVVAPRRLRVALVRVDRASDSPYGAGLALDPDSDALLVSGVVHPV